MTWEISFPCGALYLHFIRCCSWLYALNLVDFVNDMAWKISFPCGALYLHLFILCLMLLLFRCIESGWLYQLYDMTDQFSLWCTLFGLHFICSAMSTTKLTGRNLTYPHYLPICQGNIFISCRDKTYFCYKDYPKKGSFLSHDHCEQPNRSLLRVLSTVCHEKPFSLPTLRSDPQKVELWSPDHVLQMLAALLWQRQSPIKLIWNGSS